MFERLEVRRCLSSVWQNPINRLDVNDSSLVTAADALGVINKLNRVESSLLPDVKPEGESFCDTNGDGRVTAADALLVINGLNRYADPLTLVASVSAESDPDSNGILLTDSIRLVGRTLADVQIEVQANGNGNALPLATGVSDPDGTFVLDVPTPTGRNDWVITATDPLGRTKAVTQVVQRGDAILNWNATILNVVRESSTITGDPIPGRIVKTPPPLVARNMAMIHTAMFDAANAVEGGYEPYLAGLVAPPNASADAAISTAAYRVATSLYSGSGEMAHWNAALAEAMSIISNGEAKDRGIEFGNLVGDAMLALRANDGSQATSAYTTTDGPGHWQPTLPDFLPPLLPQWPNVQTFAIESVTDFRPAAPPELSSDEYATAVDEVLRLGRLDSPERTADQTEIANFWADGADTATPPGHWNRIASDVLIGQSKTLLDNSRTFAMLNLALADAGIASWDAKYHYDLWRPIDAIRQADHDNNDATQIDSSWLPLLTTPQFPTYTSGHSTFSGAADAVLSALLGDNVHFTSDNDPLSPAWQHQNNPGLVITRSFDSFALAADEAGISRIYGGIHFNFDNTAGLDSGRAVGTYVVSNVLQPRV